MPLTYSQHALARMNERNISLGFVQATVDAGNYVLQYHGSRMYQAAYVNAVPMPVINQWGYHQLDPWGIPMYYSQILNQFLVTVITNASGTHVVTVWWN